MRLASAKDFSPIRLAWFSRAASHAFNAAASKRGTGCQNPGFESLQSLREMSRGPLQPILGNQVKGAPITFERGLLSAQLLPALDHNIGILGIEIQSAANALAELRRRERRPAAQKWVIHQFAALSVVQDRA